MRFSTAIIFKDNDVARGRYKRAAPARLSGGRLKRYVDALDG